MAEFVRITDVGPRDGLQNQAKSLTPAERIRLIKALSAAGVRSIEVGAFVSSKAVPAMMGTDQVFTAVASTDNVDFQVLIPNRKGYDLARACGVNKTLLVVAASETMNKHNVRATIAQSMAVATDVIGRSSVDGTEAAACVAVAWECPFEGKTSPEQVHTLTRQFLAMGCKEVVIADTIGAANPQSVFSLMSALVEEFGAEKLVCHFHDTRAMGLANVYAGLQAGIRKFDASIGGLGGCPFAPGATGNVATEDVVMMLHQMGYDTGIDLPSLMKAGQLAGDLVGISAGGRGADWRTLQLAKSA